MFDISALGINPGYIAVLFGLLLFWMGRWHGKQVGFDDGAEQMIVMLEKNKFLKVRRKFVDADGNQHTEYARHDE